MQVRKFYKKKKHVEQYFYMFWKLVVTNTCVIDILVLNELDKTFATVYFIAIFQFYSHFSICIIISLSSKKRNNGDKINCLLFIFL